MTTNCIAATAQTESESSLLSRHEKLIRHQVKAFAGRGSDVDDLMQEGRIAFLNAAKSWRGINGASLWSYARQFVFGALLRYVNYEEREPARRPEGAQGGEAFADALSDERTPESALELSEALAIARDALSQLTLTERRIVRLSFLEELDVRAIGERLDMPKSTVQDTLKSALGKLRTIVGARL